jgi:hypothetical protein
MAKKGTKESFIEKAKNVHGDAHDYRLVDYKNSRTKVDIICNKHNKVYSQLPSTHINGANGCTHCYGENMTNIKTYSAAYYTEKIEKLNLPLYEIKSIKGGDDIILSCSYHGDFTTTYTLIKRSKKHACPKCMQETSTQGVKKDTYSFTLLAKETHKDNYDYSQVHYTGNKDEVIIGCNTCKSIFSQKPTTHLSGKGCPNCWKNRNRQEKPQTRISIKEVDKKCNLIFNNTLDFTNSQCVTSNDKMKVFCKKCNSEFEQYKGHLMRGVGCQKCSKEEKESKSEKLITKILLENHVVFNKEHCFEDCVYKKKLRFDFYIPELNMCIEYQGQQHYKPIKIFGGQDAFTLQLKKDNIKREYCKNNNIQLLEIMYSDNIEEKIKTECFTQYN